MNIKACITFFYNSSRLVFLEKNIKSLQDLNASVEINVITNASSPEEIGAIKNVSVSQKQIHIHTPKLIGHPYFLPWSHLDVFREDLMTGGNDYYLYLEDDLLFSQKNLDYFIKYKSVLRP